MKQIKDYVEIINSDDADVQRNTYSFTCSNRTLEGRAIMTYLEYLKDNNVAYGRFLKDILYNGAIDTFKLPLPRKGGAMGVGLTTGDVASDTSSKVSSLCYELLSKVENQDAQLKALYNIIENQTELIKKISISSNINSDSVAVSLDEKLELSDDEIRAEQERERMTANMKGQSSSMFSSI